ncbi:disease resistance protein RPM1 [Vigna unguiculata]|uniref:Disease resistance protein RPM1 n=1 Tax=Vigna unguiculata TaxID=3917 RepID=A0A4D6LPQ8_VIGUN|nr:disease resistance protein RPM1 [Vigna unguiculata]
MAEALLGIVIENLQSLCRDQFSSFLGVDQQTQKLSSNLTAIRAVFRDAERKQIKNHAVKDWLQKLTDAAYVLDDILDECSIHSTKMHSVDGHTSRLSRLHPKDILFRFHIGKRMKDITQRSFFQEAKFDEFGMIISFKMHDLFHDLAQFVMGEECVVIETGRFTELSARVHHLRLLNNDVPVYMSAFKKVESMRTILNYGCFSQLPSNHGVRALCTKSFPRIPLNDLVHLRYLSMRGRLGASVLNSICGLPKLQILKLKSCTDVELPKKLTQLQDLRHVLIDDCASIAEMPPNISKLRHLRTLSIFVVGSKPGCGLAELHSLKLGGALRIRGLNNVPSEWDAKQANLMSKKELNHLHLSWSSSTNSKSSNVSVERVLEALEPPSTLKSFHMNGYEGRQLSSWMRSPVTLRELVEVKLFRCYNCEELPPLGKLPHMKRLEVSGMKNVKCIDGETYDGVEKAFPSLEELILENLPKLERLLRDEGVEMLPRLSQLTIKKVSNFKFPRLPSVEKLYVESIDEVGFFMEGVVGNTPCLKTLNITSIKGVKTLPDQFGTLDALEDLCTKVTFTSMKGGSKDRVKRAYPVSAKQLIRY